MITAANEISLTPGKTAPAAAGGKQTDDGGTAQAFSALLSSKMNDRQQARSAANAADQKTADDDHASAAAATQANAAAHTDPVEEKREDKLAGDALGNSDSGDAVLPAVVDTAAPPAASPTTTTQQADDADPALNSSAAQALMALLAQTAAAQPAAATSATAAASVAAVSGDRTTAVAVDATANDVQVNGAGNAGNSLGANADSPADAAAARLQDQTQTVKSVLPAVTPPLYGQTPDKNAALKTLPAGQKMPATTLLDTDSQGKNAASAIGDKEQTVQTDSGTLPTTANPVQQGGSDATQDVALGTANSTLALKKTSGSAFDNQAAQAAAAPAATSTLSAAGSATAAPTPVSALISAQLGSDEWQQAIGQQVVMFSRNGQQSAELRLHPDNLGSLQISLQMDTNNQMQIHLASGHSQVRAALEDALPNLRAALAQSGINLGQSSVGSDATPNWSGNGQDSSANGRGTGTFSLNAVAQQADNTLVTTAPSTSTGRTAGIDTFA